MLGTRRQALGRVAAELLIVFVGVTAAFFVENLRERWSSDSRAEQVAAVLYRDLSDYLETTRGFIDEIERGLRDWHERRADGMRPVPYILRIPGSEAPPITVWQASMEAGIADLLDPRLVGELAFFYSEISGSAEKYRRHSVFTEQVVWPILDGDTTSFYDARGTLRPEFQAQYRLLGEIKRDMERQAVWASDLLRELEAAVPDIREMR